MYFGDSDLKNNFLKFNIVFGLCKFVYTHIFFNLPIFPQIIIIVVLVIINNINIIKSEFAKKTNW